LHRHRHRHSTPWFARRPEASATAREREACATCGRRSVR
jgi:hypothetical protein